ncbi:MAG: hypothetical protein DRP61_02345 [Candidatus Omnitrophota bacterium]|mgnify:CR=1 FL=1|nr:MAG: hypothetical protein DRP61_02345 [Candidatus Omnitrophota bacterium]RKY44592.1 MAG: hypothetical protein DRP80_01975 [Candidatus Omnitrophota bacterium]
MVVLALGADIKNRFLLAKDKKFYFGPVLGDLSLVENYNSLKNSVYKIIRRDPPQIIACDLHPGYFSSLLAEEVFNYLIKKSFKVRLIKVQHHFAHLGSLILEKKISSPLIGVCFDGTGFGLDHNIWGGEFILAKGKKFIRLAYFNYIKMPGGERVISEPWRIALSILGEKALPFLNKVKTREKKLILEMVSKSINTPLTSSVGRLFDGLSALLGVCVYSSYEAEAAVKLEKLCKEEIDRVYKFKIDKKDNTFIIDSQFLFLEILKDIKKKTPKEVIATKFHNSLTGIVLKVVEILSSEYNTQNVGLTGGVFQNNFLRKKVLKDLASQGFKVFINQDYPVNDLNIALGQYYLARPYQ